MVPLLPDAPLLSGMSHKYPLECIQWDDASSDSGWHSAADVKLEAQMVTTLGFVIKENEKYILIAHTYSGDDFVGWFQIPKAIIVSREKV
jgi:hypothetical protein